jgi:hypothetical protein
MKTTIKTTEYFYSYRITCTHPVFQKHGIIYYYGSRKSVVPPKLDVHYWSSSRLLKQARQIVGEKYFKKKFLAEFSTRESALNHEIKLHERFNVKNHPAFFNLANQTSYKFTTPPGPLNLEQKRKLSEKATGRKHTPETKAALSFLQSNKPREPLSKEHKFHISKALIGHSCSDETKEKMRLAKFKKTGHTQTVETRKIQSEKQKSRHLREKNVQITCPWCNKTGFIAGLRTWHFTNCQKRKMVLAN